MGRCSARHLAAALSLIAALFSETVSASAGPNDVAIIIANKDYQRGVRGVDYALRDGEAFKRIATTIFQVPERNIVELPNAGFTRLVELFGYQGHGGSELSRLIRAKDAKIYFFYSGHGMTLADGGGEPFHVLLPVDSHPDTAAVTGYRRAWIEKALGDVQRARAPDGHVFLFMDACFSGGSGGGDLVRDTSMVGNNAAAVKEKAVDRILVVSASGAREVAYWDTQRKRGVYTDALVFGLFGAADDPAHGGNGDGHVTAEELERFLLARVDQRLAAISPAGLRRHQTPGVIGQKAMVLATLPKSLQAADEELAHEERTQCRQLAAQPEATQIRAFLAACMTCAAPCRLDLAARLATLERGDAACASERRLFAPLHCPADRARIADLAAHAECAAVKAEAAALLGGCAPAAAPPLPMGAEKRSAPASKAAVKDPPRVAAGPEPTVSRIRLLSSARRIAEGVKDAGARADALSAVAGAFLEQGLAAQALDLQERALPDLSLISLRVMTLAAMGRALTRLGRPTDASAKFDAAIKLAGTAADIPSEPYNHKLHVLLVTADQQALSGLKADAMATFALAMVAASPEEPSLRLTSMGRLAHALGRHGFAAEAQSALVRAHEAGLAMKDYYGPTFDPIEAARALKRAGLPAEALATLERARQTLQALPAVKNQADQLSWAIQLAEAQASLGMPEQAAVSLEWAVKLAAVETDEWTRELAMTSVALSAATMGLADKAMQIVSLIQSEGSRSNTLRGIAKQLAVVGRAGDAERVEQAIPDREVRIRALIEMAEAHAEQGRSGEVEAALKRARPLAQGVEDDATRAVLLAEIAVGYLATDLPRVSELVLADAMAAASKIASAEQADVLGKIGAVQASAGMPEEAKMTFDRAMMIAKEITDAAVRARLSDDLLGREIRSRGEAFTGLSAIATAHARANRVSDAIRLLDLPQNADRREAALLEVVEALVKLGRLAQVDAVAAAMRDPFERAKAYVTVARAHTKAGVPGLAEAAFANALAAAERTEDRQIRDILIWVVGWIVGCGFQEWEPGRCSIMFSGF